jgi:eukaryotic-like serine/threonine-protein kinase
MAAAGHEKTDSSGQASSGAKPGASTKQRKTTQLGDFKLLKKLGQGGMGEVYLALQCSLDRKVALKILSKELAKKPGLIDRFTREARAMAKLDHPYAVKAFVAESDKGLHYVAIEYIDGKSMQDWMDQLKRLSIGDSVRVVLDCADALQQAHEINLIHRDIKPDNILLTRRGVVKVADFGLAKVIDDEDMSMTRSGTGMGTPLYMPPEQARSAKHVDHRSDIYALGCTLYYFITGKLPFRAESLVDLISAKEAGKFKSARKLNSEVPERLDLIIDRAIASDPAHRYQSVADFANDLESLGVASGALTFVDEPTATGAARTPARRADATTKAPDKMPTRQATSAADAERSELSDRTQSQESWFVRHSDAKGQTKVSEMTTVQIRKGLKAGMLDAKAKACRTNGPREFLPLAQFAEFEAPMKQRLAKAQADARSQNMRDMYQKLDKQERKRQKWRWFKSLTQGVFGWFGLLIYLTIVAAVLYGGYWAVRFLVFPMISDSLNLQ